MLHTASTASCETIHFPVWFLKFVAKDNKKLTILTILNVQFSNIKYIYNCD